MDFKGLQDEVSDWINFTAGVAQQDFTTAQLKKAINAAYKREVAKARQEGGSNFFVKYNTATWTASASTLVVPNIVNQTTFLWLEDITDNDPGYELSISDNSLSGSELFWLDNRTLQWGEDGPSVAKTLRFHYLARPVDMVGDSEIPDLIPEDFHELIVLSAGVYLRFKADEMAPAEWKGALNEARMDFWKEVSIGRPRASGRTVRRINALSDYDAPSQDRSSISSDQNT